MDGFMKRGDASKALKIYYHTLHKLADNKEIEVITIGNKKFYNVKKYLDNKGLILSPAKRNVCYCRVSSSKPREDLERQIKFMQDLYPSYEIIFDIASGLNYNRKGLKKILDYASKNELGELVVAYKDRLTRFGFELIEWMIKKMSNGKIKVLNNNEELTPQEEITKDIISIMNIYVAKHNGLRKYKKEIVKQLHA